MGESVLPDHNVLPHLVSWQKCHRSDQHPQHCLSDERFRSFPKPPSAYPLQTHTHTLTHTHTHTPHCHVGLQPLLQPLLPLTHLQTACCMLALGPQWDKEPWAQPPPGTDWRIAQLEHRCPPKWSMGGWGGLHCHYKTSETLVELGHEGGRPWWWEGKRDTCIRKCLMGPGRGCAGHPSAPGP